MSEEKIEPVNEIILGQQSEKSLDIEKLLAEVKAKELEELEKLLAEEEAKQIALHLESKQKFDKEYSGHTEIVLGPPSKDSSKDMSADEMVEVIESIMEGFDEDDYEYEDDDDSEGYTELTSEELKTSLNKFDVNLDFLADYEKYPDILKLDETSWQQYWPNVDENIDPCQAAADNYLLYGMANNAFVQVKPQQFPTDEEIQQAGLILKLSDQTIQERLEEIAVLRSEDASTGLKPLALEANQKYIELITRLDHNFREYAHMACGGELRHMIKGYQPYSGARRVTWSKWHFVYEKYGNAALEFMIDTFLKYGGASFGGKRWAAAAEILLDRELGKLGPNDIANKQVFVDRVFTLQHNTGKFINKLHWANHRKNRKKGNERWEDMHKTVLAAHASNPVDIRCLYERASEEIQEMVDNYMATVAKYDLEIIGVWDQKPELIKAKADATSPTSKLDWSDVPDFVEDDDDDDDVDVNVTNDNAFHEYLQTIIPTIEHNTKINGYYDSTIQYGNPPITIEEYEKMINQAKMYTTAYIGDMSPEAQGTAKDSDK